VSGSAFRADVVSVALSKIDDDDEVLVLLLERAWRAVGQSLPPTRGAKEYWRSIAIDLLEDIRTQGETIVVTVGIVADRALEWAAHNGVPAVEPYAVPLGVLTALATRRLLSGPRQGASKRDGGSPDGSN
jgi:hypothetical protein